ncbi:MAG: cobalamin-dependent protein [Deltaproteobacteria bacterium]|nr:cobalamin-dependent protein [Deltaproteobacteria bacterium]
MTEAILAQLKRAILESDVDDTPDLARKALEDAIDPFVVMDTMIEAIQKVGDDFGAGYLFLPELVGSGKALEEAVPIVEEAIQSKGGTREPLGVMVIGTVQGDLHTIGKSLVTTMFSANGFKVHDLGIDVSTEKFVEAVKEFNPHILALSALLTSTAPEARAVIDTLQEAGLRDKVKIMVGGGAITEDFALSIGADGYDATAPGAVEVGKKLLGL